MVSDGQLTPVSSFPFLSPLSMFHSPSLPFHVPSTYSMSLILFLPQFPSPPMLWCWTAAPTPTCLPRKWRGHGGRARAPSQLPGPSPSAWGCSSSNWGPGTSWQTSAGGRRGPCCSFVRGDVEEFVKGVEFRSDRLDFFVIMIGIL